MLYERWRKIAVERRKETALRDISVGKSRTFDELFAAGEKQKAGAESAAFPQGHSAEFILTLLAAWRQNQIACPLEPNQPPPFPESQFSSLRSEIPGCVHLKTTSATGGAARLVAFTEQQLAADAENILATMGLRADWPNLGAISLAHSYGFSNLVLPLLLHGIPLILVPAPLPEIIRLEAEKEKAITLAAVPTLWRAWQDAGAIPPNVRRAISAGAPLPLNLEQSVFESSGLKIHNFLGSSECGGIAYDASESPREDGSCAGQPLQNVDLSVNPDGRLVVHSRAVAETYWPKKSDSLGRRVFQTNDLAELKNGRVFLRGRLGDLINVAGRKISPETIERALLEHPNVRECLVIGAPSRDAERLETIVAVVVARAGESELKEFLLGKLPAWQVPREWHFVDALTTNERGKISRTEWREAILGRGAKVDDPSAPGKLRR
jgi:acyl-coenzyme A synthetase/AMP-(fatty) acid ligase